VPTKILKWDASFPADCREEGIRGTKAHFRDGGVAINKNYRASYYLAHREDALAREKRYRQSWTSAQKERRIAYDKAYHFAHREKRAEQHKIWSAAHPRQDRRAQQKIYRTKNRDRLRLGKKIRNAKRYRNLDYNMLNVSFPGSIGHHINDNDVVFIPANIHVSFSAGPKKNFHRERIMNYYGDLDNMINNLPLERICGG